MWQPDQPLAAQIGGDCAGRIARLNAVGAKMPALARALSVDEARAERGFRAEVAYYLEHQLEAFDTARLWDLRRRCAAVSCHSTRPA